MNNRINETVLQVLQKMANKAIELDPESFHLIEQLDGIDLKLVLVNTPVSVLVSFGRTGLSLDTGDNAFEPDLVLSGRLAEWWQWIAMVRKGVIPSGMLNVQGDVGKLNKLNEVLKQYRPDFEEPFTRILGDTVGHQFYRASRSLANKLKHDANSLLADVREYIQYESDLLPQGYQFEAHAKSVEDLRDRIERLNARLSMLEVKMINNKPTETEPGIQKEDKT